MAHYFITGHTGFKGAWLILLLKAQGHDVSGLGLEPLPGSIFARTNLEKELVHDFRVDIRNNDETVEAIKLARPDLVIHMAAQALVREGYRNPRYTYETNVLGTLNVLEAVDQTDSVRGHLVVTTDKVYLDQGLDRPYVETDPLGGKDPYSASKAMADIMAQEFIERKNSKPGAIVRAGNVIGSGDISKDRLMSEIVEALATGSRLFLRNPGHVRPWQHVLDCLGGYLRVLDFLSEQGGNLVCNVGPDDSDSLRVIDLIELVKQLGLPLKVGFEKDDTYPEEAILALDSSQMTGTLGWRPKLGAEESVQWALADFLGPSMSIRLLLEKQIQDWNHRASR